jgi:hypothetical protein
LFIGFQWVKQYGGKEIPKREIDEEGHIFSDMMIALSGRMSRTHVMPLSIPHRSYVFLYAHESKYVDPEM